MAEFSFDYVNYVLNDIYIRFPHFVPYLAGWFSCLTVLAVYGEIKKLIRNKRVKEELLIELDSEDMYLEKAKAIENTLLLCRQKRLASFVRKHMENLTNLEAKLNLNT